MDQESIRLSLQRLSKQRKSEINNRIKNNIYGYFIINTFWGLILCSAASFFLENRFPTVTFLFFTAIYFVLALITFRVDYFDEKEHRRKRNIILMVWNNIFYFVLAFWFSYISISVLINLKILFVTTIRLLVYISIFSIFLYWWLPNKLQRELRKINEVSSMFYQQRDNDGVWVIGWMILFAAIFSRLNQNLEAKIGLIIGASIFGLLAIWLLLKSLFQAYRDFQIIKFGYI
jgi:hypothetical protein